MDSTNAPRPHNVSLPPSPTTHSLSGSADPPCLTAALAYRARGWWPFPVCAWNCPCDHPKDKPHGEKQKGKCPLIAWAQRVKRHPTEEELRGWWRKWPTANVAILTGAHSGVLAVDFDGQSGEEAWIDLFGSDTPLTPGFRTSGDGRRALYQLPPGFACPTTNEPTADRPLTFLATGSITVMPPSRHRSGCLYADNPGANIFTDPLTMAFPALLNHMASKTKKRQKASVCLPVAREEKPATAKQRTRAVGKAKAWEPAFDGKGGRLVAFNLANTLVNGLGLSVEEALSVMMDHWNGRCVPPWTEEELRERVQSAARDGRHEPIPEKPLAPQPPLKIAPASAPASPVSAQGEAGEDRGQGPGDRLPFIASGGVDTPTTAANGPATSPARPSRARPARTRSRAKGPDPASNRQGEGGKTALSNAACAPNGQEPDPTKAEPGPVEADQGEAVQEDEDNLEEGVLSFGAEEVEPIEWFIEPYLARGLVTILVGEWGTGKTTFATWAMTHSRKILFLPGEEDIRKVALPRVVEAGLNPRDRVKWIPVSDGWRLPSNADKLIRLIRKEGVDLVIIDPLEDYFDYEIQESQNKDIRCALQSLREIAEATNVVIIVLRHPGKAAGNVMAESRAWGNHPRSILHFIKDPHVEDHGFFRPYKPTLGRRFPARRYHLEKEEGKTFPRFILDGEVSAGVAKEAGEITDRVRRSKLDLAEAFVRRVLAGGPMDSRLVYKLDSEKLGEDAIYRAATDRIGVVMKRSGKGKKHKCMWSLPPAHPAKEG